MQLIDYLKAADKDEYIYLGAASMYLWISKPDEMIAKLPELDAVHTDRLQYAITSKERAIAYYERCFSSAQSEFEEKELQSNLGELRRKKSFVGSPACTTHSIC